MPNRMLRDWTDSENIDKLTQGAEIFFTRLIMKADDNGCYHGNPKLLNSYLFPYKKYTEEQIQTWINECEIVKIITVYTHEDKKFIKIEKYGQRLRTVNSKFPQPDVNPASKVSKTPPEVEEEEEDELEGEVEAVVSYLNLVVGSSFKTKTDKTKKHISARLNEKFNVDDFKSVIDYKFKEWGTDEKMAQYLRPETLFGTKFEGYLQASKKIIINGAGKQNNSNDAKSSRDSLGSVARKILASNTSDDNSGSNKG